MSEVEAISWMRTPSLRLYEYSSWYDEAFGDELQLTTALNPPSQIFDTPEDDEVAGGGGGGNAGWSMRMVSEAWADQAPTASGPAQRTAAVYVTFHDAALLLTRCHTSLNDGDDQVVPDREFQTLYWTLVPGTQPPTVVTGNHWLMLRELRGTVQNRLRVRFDEHVLGGVELARDAVERLAPRWTRRFRGATVWTYTAGARRHV